MASFTNQATLSYNNTVTNSNVVSGEVLDALSATKTALTPIYSSTRDVTFAISLLSTGGVPLSGITVTDNLGAYPFGDGTLVPFRYREGTLRLFVNGLPAATPTVTATDPLTVTGISLPAGGNGILLYEAVPTEYAPLAQGSSVTNTATVSGAGLTAPLEASETVAPENAPYLSITKSLSPAVVTENSQITYTFVIQNFGNTAASVTDNVAVSDTFLPVLEDLTVTLNGAPLAEGTGYTYDSTGGLFATLPGVITVPAATFTQDPVTGEITTTPGTATLTVVGTV